MGRAAFMRVPVSEANDLNYLLGLKMLYHAGLNGAILTLMSVVIMFATGKETWGLAEHVQPAICQENS